MPNTDRDRDEKEVERDSSIYNFAKNRLRILPGAVYHLLYMWYR
ncbi:hypothetical protein [Coprococcus aceti]|nr:hypothetical protein [Coprococcus aceti]